jgi:hypothetical protein
MEGQYTLVEQVVSRLIDQKAVDLSDAELERCLRPTVGGMRLVMLAVLMRDAGRICEDDLKPHEKN